MLYERAELARILRQQRKVHRVGTCAGVVFRGALRDWRSRPPVWFDIGLVLDRDDVVAGKVLALWGRQEARNYIDGYVALTSGEFRGLSNLWLTLLLPMGIERSILKRAGIEPSARCAAASSSSSGPMMAVRSVGTGSARVRRDRGGL